MTEHDESGLHPADLAGAYALHALDAEESAAFEAYLTGSERARIEVVELTDTAVALGLAVAPVQPSATLKSNLMSLLSSTPQLPRVAGPSTTDASITGTPSVGGPVVTATDLAVAPAVTPPSTDDAAESANSHTRLDQGQRRSSATDRAQSRWFKRPALSLLAAAAAVALFVGGTFLGQTFNTNQFESQQASSLAQINAAGDSQRSATTTADGQEATLVWSNTLGLSAVLVANLPALPGDKDYQLWYINGDGAAPAGTFDSTGDGTVWRVLDGTMQPGDQVGVTVEPSGGSDQPTTKPIVAFQS